MNTVIKVENLSKQYRLGNVGLGSLNADVNRWWQTKIMGREDPYLKIGQENNRETADTSGYVWALRDISFNVQQGEVLGIIGRNGAGKSTLLKILSRVTGPTTGSIKIKGRVASLLEVGTGFHPELTGRENIFLNGAILGMTKTEIRSKFDEIVNFAGVEKYVDTPVKRYSSGMYVRLAFAVAAHLEPEILIVDEVLAVGDAEFQKKAIGKMKEVSKGGGRTVLFVSHNMVSVKNLCKNGIVLSNGGIEYKGGAQDAIDFYSLKNDYQTFKDFEPNLELSIELLSIKMMNKNHQEIDRIITGSKVFFEITYQNNTEEFIIPAIGFYDGNDYPQILCGASFKKLKFRGKGKQKVTLEIDRFPLLQGEYYLNVELKGNRNNRRHIEKVMKIFVENGDFYGYGLLPGWRKGVLIDFEWK